MKEGPLATSIYQFLIGLAILFLLLPLLPVIIWLWVNIHLTRYIIHSNYESVLITISSCAILWIGTTCLLGMLL